MHNISNVIKDDIMHYFIHSPFTIICPMFFTIFLTFKIQNNCMIISNSNIRSQWYRKWKIVKNWTIV